MLVVAGAAAAQTSQPPSPVGLWQTIDDKTHKPKALVRIYEQQGELFGKIEAILDPAKQNDRCDKCPGDRKDKPVLGLVILRNMKPAEAGYGGGDILDPETGSVYRCKLRLEDAGRKLIVRGYMGFSLFGRSQTWVRKEGAAAQSGGS